MSKSKIEWTDAVWNPVTGCTKLSEGCRNCYAERLWPRLRAMGNTAYRDRNFNDVACHPERLDQPLQWKKPRRIFVNSMSDLFHDDVPFEFIRAVWVVMTTHRDHTYMVLTKRPRRMLEFFAWNAAQELKVETYRNNVWLGVSIENQAVANERIPLLLQAPVTVRFVSCEPLLGPVNLERIEPKGKDAFIHSLSGTVSVPFTVLDNRPKLNWVIVGGESGPRARPMHPDWASSLRDQCRAEGVPFFFKQWGEFREVRRYNSWPKYRDTVGEVAKAIGTTHSGRAALLNIDGSDLVNGGPDHKFFPISHLKRVGKKEAGRELGGRTWDEIPNGGLNA